jgi:hypothetical protein
LFSQQLPLRLIDERIDAIEYLPGVSCAEMLLTGFGALGSLARQGLRLEKGMSLVLFEPNDIDVLSPPPIAQSKQSELTCRRTGNWRL